MKNYAFLVFGYLCVNAAIWTLNMAALLPAYREPIMDPSSMATLFSLDVFAAVTGIVGGAVIGILALMTKSYALSGGVLILWIIGVLFRPIQDIFVGLPYLLEAVLPPGIAWFSQVVVGFSAVILFLFIVGIIAGRDILK